MKVVGYIRVSTETQVREGNGLNVQKEQIEKYCKTHNLELANIYDDKGISGAKADEESLTVNREGLQNMLADLKSIGAKYIVVLNTSRLWRSDLVKVLIQRDIFSQDDPSQFLVNGMMELLDQYQRLDIILRLKRGKLNKAKSGGFVGGQRALGYKQITVNNKQDITIDYEDANIVSMVKALRSCGLSMRSIANHLNDKQFPTKRGGKWHASTIHYILKNRLYEGLFEYNSIKTKRLDLAIQ